MARNDAQSVTLSVDAQTATDLYRRMLLIRGFEDRVQSLFLRGEVYGTTHLYSGQEAVAVGFADVLQASDRIACTYRGHGHLLAMGTDPTQLLAELLGRATGVNGGLAGSMNVVDPENGVLGCYGIVGGSIAAATGAAISLRRTGGVAVAYFGDGAANQAYFFECLNFAKVLGLPVVFVCENNQYGEYTPTDAVTPGGILPRAAVLEIPTRTVDGMDVWAVRDGRFRGRRARSERRGASIRRSRDVPLRRPFAQRSGEVPPGRRARPLEGTRPARRRGDSIAGRLVARRRPARIARAGRRAIVGRDRANGARGAVPGPQGTQRVRRGHGGGADVSETDRAGSPDPAEVVDVGMPRLSDSMEEATVLRWLKAPGDAVVRGEPLVEVETDKATIVYEAELDGVVVEIVVGEGETVVLGAVIARVRPSGAATPPVAPARSGEGRASASTGSTRAVPRSSSAKPCDRRSTRSSSATSG